MIKNMRRFMARVPWAVVLVVEVVVFFGGFGWFLGAWERPEYPEKSSDFQFAITLFYGFGIFTFLFFAVALLPLIVRRPFILVTAVFIMTAIPCAFLSAALTNTLRVDVPYTQSLEEAWGVINGIIPFITPHILGFMLALAMRKVAYL